MRRVIPHWLFAAGLAAMSGCGPTAGEQFRDLKKQIIALQVDKIQLQERLEERDARISSMDARFRNLQAAGTIPPEPVFRVDRIKVLDITGGVDLDGTPGDDAVAVYFRPIDKDGDALKRAGEIEVRLLDNLANPQPRVLGQRVDNDPDRIRKMWYGKFWTHHYKVVVPFTSADQLTPGQEVDVIVRFMEFATGREFKDRKVIKINRVFPEKNGDR